MKKMLAITVAAAFAAPAMADTTLYGKLHNAIQITDSGADGAGTQTTVSSNSSRIGVKGSEKLTDDLSAIYQIEWGLNSAENGSGLSDRNRYLGLKGSWGALVTGRIDTPEKNVGRKAELMGDSIGDARAITGRGIADARANDVVAYMSPKMGGASFAVAAVHEDGGNQTQGYSANAMYKAGGLTAGVGHTNVDGAGDTTRIAGKYDFGAGAVTALIQQDNDLSGVDGADRDVWGIGGMMKTASGAVKIQHYNAGETGEADNTGASLTAVGYDHNLSKRTTLYARYAQVDNDENANYALGGGVGDNVPAAAGDDPSGVALGLIHKF
jgi:predicted porin